MWRGVLVFFLFLFCGCQEELYKDPAQVFSQSFKRNLSGVVFLGNPVSQSKIKVYEFESLKQGKLLAQGFSNQDGEYEISFVSPYQGPLLLLAEGGRFRDLASHEEIVADAMHPLMSAIPHSKLIGPTNINAWTTMAVARMMAKKGFYDTRIQSLSDRERIEEDFAAISHFLSTDDLFVNVAKAAMADEISGSDSAKLRLYLAHGGLSMLAKNSSASSSLHQFIARLSQDMENRKFDGRDGEERPIRIADRSNKYLTSNTLRRDLAVSTAKFVVQDSQLFSNPSLELLIKSKSGFINSITRASSPLLFSELDEARRLESKKPKLEITFVNKPESFGANPIFKDKVKFQLDAYDDSGIAKLEILEPALGQVNNGQVLSLSEDLLPQSEKAAEACGLDKDNWPKVYSKNKTDSAICICAKATDSLLNESFELKCFEREKPFFEIENPQAGHIVTITELDRGYILIGKGSSGHKLVKCSWEIDWYLTKDRNKNIKLPSGQGQIDGKSCQLNFELNRDNIPPNGIFHIKYKLEDQAGQIFERGYGKWRGRTFKIHAENPEIEILSPKEGIKIAASKIEILVKERSQTKIESVQVELFEGSDWSKSRIFRAKKDGQLWRAELDQLENGESYTYKVVAKSYNSGSYSTSYRALLIDTEAPQIEGASLGVPQLNYVSETSRYVAEKNIIVPEGEPQQLWSSSKDNPTIKRWGNRIDDESSAPSYSFRVEDNLEIKEVRYGIGTRCADLENANNLADLTDGYGTAKLLGRNFSENISNLRNRPMCLSIWAVDKAGNASNHKKKFSWSTLAPPIGLRLNPQEIAYFDDNDFGADDSEMQNLLVVKNGVAKLRKKTVVSHLLLSNVYDHDIEFVILPKSKLSLELVTKTKVITEQEYLNYVPSFMRPRDRGFKEEFNWWGISEPFSPYRFPFAIGFPYTAFYYEHGCNRDELAIYVGEPEWRFFQALPNALQRIECRKPDIAPGVTGVFPPPVGMSVLESEKWVFELEDDKLEKLAFKYDPVENILLDPVKQKDGKINIGAGEQIIVTLRLKSDFEIPMELDDREIDVCIVLNEKDLTDTKRRIGSCNFALSSAKENEGYTCFNTCRGHFLYRTIEEIGFSFGKIADSKNDSALSYFVNNSENPRSYNLVNALWDSEQYQRRRIFVD